MLVARLKKSVNTQCLWWCGRILLNISGPVNTLLSRKQTLKKRSTLTVLRDTYILCRTFIRVLFAFHKLKQFIHLKWLLNILYHVSHSYLVISSQIKHWFFLCFVNSDRHIFRKTAHVVGKIKINIVIVSQTWTFWK